jgi:TonB family protein
VSEDKPHGATEIHASKGGGAAKWIIGAVGAAVLLGAGFVAWKYLSPDQGTTQTAYDDAYAAGPLEPSQDITVQSAAAADSAASPADEDQQASAAPARRSTARPRAVPEQTIGVTPASASTQDSDEIVVTARRPVWAQMPSARRLSAMYPATALERGREGEASLHCTVQDRGALDCVQVSETSRGFGHAAMRVARTLRHAPTLSDGREAAGTPVNLRVVFRMDEGRRRRG